MKIKTWLLCSFFFMMILPLVVGYVLFAWVNAYDSEQQVKEYFQTLMQVQGVQEIVEQPTLYTRHRRASYAEVEELVSNRVAITLYNEHGLVLYTSENVPSPFTLNKEFLYEGLYQLEKGFRVYTYKQPVFDGHRLVGIYEVKVVREDWMEQVGYRTFFAIVLFVVLFSLLYFFVSFLVNRKINRRLQKLMKEMTDFASGKAIQEEPIGQDEIGVLQRQFYTMRKQILETQKEVELEREAKEYMIAAISHDLKTPLTSIRASAEALNFTQQTTVCEQRKYYQIIMDKVSFMKQMIDDLLTYSLLQSKDYELAFVEVEGSEFFEMLLSDYEQLCVEKQIQLQVFLAVDGTYQVHPKQLIRVVDNLMSNAIQHTKPNGRIGLAATSQKLPSWLFEFVQAQYEFDGEQFIYLIVQNEGAGLTETDVKNVFKPLYQADQARTKKEHRGTGLGLSITQQIIEKHHGHIAIFAEESQGVCVICRLPKIKLECDECEMA